MPDFKDLDALIKYIQKDINSGMNIEVADVTEDALVEAVDDKVYKSGEPISYPRRGLYAGSGGLGDKNNMYHDPVTDGVLEVTDLAQASKQWDMDLDSAIVRGYGDKSHWWNEERNFYQDAREKLQESQAHVKALKKSLESKGYKVTG